MKFGRVRKILFFRKFWFSERGEESDSGEWKSWLEEARVYKLYRL